MKSGVYTITNIINNKVYVGCSINIKNRFLDHKKMLRKGNHGNVILQRSFNLYGEKSFLFEILVNVDVDFIYSEENYWCNILNSHNKLFGYNIKKTSPRKPYWHSEDVKKDIGLVNKGKLLSEDHKEKIRVSCSNPNVKKEVAKGIVKRTGIKQTKEHISKRVSFHIGAKRTNETCKNISQSLFRIKRKVYMFNKNGNLLDIFESLSDVGREFGFDVSAISKCCRGIQKESYNYIWKY